MSAIDPGSGETEDHLDHRKRHVAVVVPNSAMLIPAEYEKSADESYAMISLLFMSVLNTDLCFSLSDPIRRSISDKDFGDISVTIFARYVFSTHDLMDFSGIGYMTLLRASARILM